MDYILHTIEKKIRRFEGTAEARVYHQVRVEYAFYLLLSYFWNKNFEEIGITDFVLQGNIIKEIQKPSIGTIASIIQKLDIANELSQSVSKKDTKPELSEYAELRNDLIGHGYSFEDDLNNFSNSFDVWYQKLLNLRVQILSRKTDLIVCQGFDETTQEYIGTIYDYEGDIRSNWRCSKEIYEFEFENLYASYEPNNYSRLSPFIHIEANEDGLFVFRNVQQALLGKLRYNRIDKSDKDFTKCWEEFEFSANNGVLKRQPNGCIINVFHPNYKRYIEVGSIKEKVYDFLTGKEKGSSVCITLWGHGGNGKTATVQKICEELSLNEKKPFEFIIFLSAKDRELNKFTGKIVPINTENRITSFEELIKKLNLLIYSEDSTDTKKIIDEKSRMLLVIDDYETFDDTDKEKITQFIKQLNTVYHKVIITTRNSFLKIGDDIQTNELDISNTIKFLNEVLTFEHNYTPLQLKDVEAEIRQGDIKKEIHKITIGKPIEIIRFVNCFVQKGKLTEDFLKDMKRVNSHSERNEFLYGRNYKQLEGDKLAQDIFTVIGLLTPQDSLTSLVKHIKFILNKKDEDEAVFNNSLDKLVKLRLIEVDEDGSYKVDSKDILEIMKQEYNKRNEGFRSGTRAFYERIKTNITTDTDRALLTHVKTLRHQSNPETTVQQYREILRQGKEFSYDVKFEALLDLGDFLFNHRGEKELAIKLFDEYFDDYYEFEVLKRYSSYSWSLDKEKSIRILESFYAKNSTRNVSITKNEKLHLLALIVMRESFYWNDKFERENNNRQKNKDQLQRIYNNYGHILFAQLKHINITKDLSSEELNDITLAIESLIDTCYRINNKPVAIEICEFGLANFPERIHFRFKRKIDKLKGYRSHFQQSRPKTLSDFGAKVKAAYTPLEIINLDPKDKGYTGTILKLYNDQSKYGYIKYDSDQIQGRIYFREASLVGHKFEQLKEGDKVKFGFGKINKTKFGAIQMIKA
ncbi:NB-ARC domain-containing protein [uncultured Acetobacteroides sp.]|uniref:NB-ARC domain-containing protein n=1 Tax=uncultured Acetobacteroides sp. TaxID=1760811 RepID=UPI0029F583C9|nr:NB-ARC domain-containing protein [uncultured Acetobacteroides sp.]